jgi:hypothetical protein
MANQGSLSSRHASPKVFQKASARARRETNPRSTDPTAVELDPLHSVGQTINANRNTDETLFGEVFSPRSPTNQSLPVPHNSGPNGPTLRQPRPHSYRGTQADNKSTLEGHTVTLLDIQQSRWIVDPNNHAAEKIYLVAEEGPLAEMSSISTDFCWVHHQRSRVMHFEYFVVSPICP